LSTADRAERNWPRYSAWVFETLAPPAIAIAEGDPTTFEDPRAALLPSEATVVSRAVPPRQTEHAVGRVLARRALADLGHPPSAIPSGSDGAPRWPEGIVGSITHVRTRCAVAVARDTDIRAIGIDLEDDAPLSATVLPEVCDPSERGWLRAQPSADRGWLGKLVFCAKEAVYKLQYPLTKTYLDFDAVTVEVDVRGGTWRATFRTPAAHAFAVDDTLAGRWALRDGLVAAAVWLPAT
jgi:4'-phosphopantetheinyl transferase EntD